MICPYCSSFNVQRGPGNQWFCYDCDSPIDTIDEPHLPEIIRQARLTAGLSQTQVARALGCQRKRITDLESGRVRLPADDLLKLARLLGIDLNELAKNHANFPSGVI